jgi:acyl-CoA thioester hydrolase
MESTAGKLLWTERIAVRWGDMDALKHVNNTEYFRYLEQARISCFDAWKLPVEPGRTGPVIARAACDFRKPITYPETVEVTMQTARIGSSSFTVTHDIRSARDAAVLYATGEVVIVWIDYRTGKAVPLSAALRAALS